MHTQAFFDFGILIDAAHGLEVAAAAGPLSRATAALPPGPPRRQRVWCDPPEPGVGVPGRRLPGGAAAAGAGHATLPPPHPPSPS